MNSSTTLLASRIWYTLTSVGWLVSLSITNFTSELANIKAPAATRRAFN
jgi:hypothetical protein